MNSGKYCKTYSQFSFYGSRNKIRITQTDTVRKTQVIRIGFSHENIPDFEEISQNFSSFKVTFSGRRQFGSKVVSYNETAEA